MLTALALLVGLLAALGIAAVPLARAVAGARAVHGATALAGFALAAGGIAGLLAGPAALDLPFGPPWGPMRLALDALSSWFLLPVGLSVGCAGLFAMGGVHGPVPARELLPWPIFVAGMVLTLLAADGFTLLLGFEAMSLASWALVAHDHAQAENRRAARIYLGFAGFGGLCLMLGFGLLAGGAGDVAFAVLRDAPPEGARAVAVLALVLAGAGSKAGLAPLHVWLPLAHPAAPSHVSAVMSGAMTKVALYVLARFVFDLMGPAQPFWMGAPLIALGAASAVIGALRATLEEDSKVLLACSTIENVGLIAIGLGLALAFRGADLPALAALAGGAALLHALNHAVFKTLLFLVAGEVLHGALSRRLDRLGGLVHRMPVTAWAALAGAAAAASLPPLSGFASEWLLLQSLLAAWRVGDIAFQMGVAAATAVAALAAALAAAAMVRFWGLVFLGRPRTPRAAGAEESAGAARIALLVPAGLTVLLGLFPGPVLDLAEPALRLIAGTSAPRAGWFAIGAGDGGARYWPVPVALLVAGAVGLAVWLMRRRSPAGVQRGPAWDCGFIAAPPHFPFGDPAGQPSPAGFAQPLRRMLGQGLLVAHEQVTMPGPGETRAAVLRAGFADPVLAALEGPLPRWRDAAAARAEGLRALSIRQCLGLTFGAVVLMLALLAWTGRTEVAVIWSVLSQLLHIALVLAAAPLLTGVVRWLKARMMGRRGAHPLQPVRDLAKLLRKRPVLAENASAVSVLAPYLAAGAAVAAAALVPSFARGMALAPLSDLILIAGLLALGRVAMALAGMDVGTPFGGLGASREMCFAALAEPALVVAVLTLAILAGTTNLDAIGGSFRDGGLGLRVSLGLALVALLAVAIAENARIPVDNPSTHLELTMVHEAMILEASGRHLALWEYAAQLRLLLWLGLLAAVFLPLGQAPAGSAPHLWAVGLAAWAVKIGGLALGLAAFESAIAKMRVFRVPEFLGAALLLGLLGAVLLFVSTGLA